MKNATKITALLSAGALLFNVATTSVMAGPFGGSIAIGVAGTLGAAETTATEKLKQSNNETSVTRTNYGGYDSFWAQYTFGEDGFVIGYEKIGRDLSIGKGLREASPPADWKLSAKTVPLALISPLAVILVSWKLCAPKFVFILLPLMFAVPLIWSLVIELLEIY